MQSSMSPIVNHDSAKIQLMAKVVWTAFLSSVVIYGGLAFALSSIEGFKPAGTFVPVSARYIFYLVGIGSAIGGIFLFENGKKPFRKNFGADNQSAKDILAPMVMCWALCETSAIMGLLKFFIFGALDAFWYLSAITVVGMVVCYPSANLFDKKVGAF
mgnify:CR=1 FL=1